jgi:hypothetical protein
MKKSIYFVTLLYLLQSCAPVFSDLQSARLVGRGNIEVTPSFSTVSFAEDGESEGIQNHIGTQAGFGLSDKVDLRLRFEHIWLKDDGSYNEQIFGIGPKFKLKENVFALYLPFGFAFSDISESLEFQPTLLMTLPLSPNKIDFNTSAKGILQFCDGCDALVAVNLGFALSEDLNRWAFRTEYGHLYNPGEQGHYGQLSVGFSYIFLKKVKTEE